MKVCVQPANIQMRVQHFIKMNKNYFFLLTIIKWMINITMEVITININCLAIQVISRRNLTA